MDTATAPVPVKRAAVAATRPFTNMFSALHQEIDRLFDDFSRNAWSPFGAGGAVPIRMDMAETQDGLELTAELPGLEEKDIQVSLADDLLTISGEKQAETEQKDKNYHFVERTYGSFARTVRLPPDVQADKIKAEVSKGVLKVTVPRAPRAEAKKIEVTATA